jgi:glucan endo-1,3-alpha-glucosidase
MSVSTAGRSRSRKVVRLAGGALAALLLACQSNVQDDPGSDAGIVGADDASRAPGDSGVQTDTSPTPAGYSFGKIPAPTVPLPSPSLVPSADTFFALSAAPLPDKKVFAHYMVCCSFKGNSDDFAAAEEEIIMAQTMGINGFALNAGAWLNAGDGPAYQAHVAAMFQAAAALNSGFALFFSADMTGLGYADIVDMMTKYANDPAYFKYQGRPVLSTYGGDGNHDSTYATPTAWWTNRVLAPLKAQGIDTFFVPDFGIATPWFDDTSPAFVAQYANDVVNTWSPLVQGLHSWMSLAVVNNQAGNGIAVPVIGAYQKALSAAGKVYMPLLITKYWGSAQPSNGNIYYEWQGGRGMNDQWRGAIDAGVPWVEIGTWNDPNESYMMPMDDFALQNPGAGMPAGWWKPSFGYAELLRYYIAWFRTGAAPTLTKDAVFWFYRTHPAAAAATDTTGSRFPNAIPVSRYVPSADGSGHVPADADQIYVTVFGTAPASLVVGSTTNAVVTGINQFSMPFSVGPAPSFQISRAGSVVVKGTGADAIIANPRFTDWWSSTGFAEK